MAEMVFEPAEARTRLCVFRDGIWQKHERVRVPNGDVGPYSAGNNLIRHDVVLFPSEPQEYGSEAQLIEDVQRFIHTYVDVTAAFETTATYYVLLSWVYDSFNELPYLRVRGDFGSGKTRFLLTVGSLCYKPIFASGASTVSPLFRILDAFKGTLVMDESDFRMTDERAEIIKILNNGNARGFPVLRSEVTNKQEYDPRAYSVFGPKIIATRGPFDDRALESRCITEDLGLRPVRADIPINLPDSFAQDARTLRNKLLLYRFRNRERFGDLATKVTPGIEARLSQVFAPLLAVITDSEASAAVLDLARSSSRQLVTDRGMDAEAHVLDVLHELLAANNGAAMSLRAITASFLVRYGTEYEGKVTARWLGRMMRSRLQLRPQKSHGVFVLPAAEFPKLRRLFERYGIGESEPTLPDDTRVDQVDMGDMVRAP